MISSLEVYPFQHPTYFRDGPDPMCRSVRSTVYLSPTARLLERLRLLDGDIGTSEAEFAWGVLVCVEATKQSKPAYLMRGTHNRW